MCGFTDEAKTAKKFRDNKIYPEKQIEQLLLNRQLENRKTAIFIFFDDGNSQIFNNSINFFYNRFDSLKHKKKTKNLNWKDQKKKEAPSIDFWNDVFLFTDKYSSKSYAILLVNINLFQNNWGTSGADVFLQIGSLITSTYVINLPGKLSEDNLEYLSFLNRMSSNSSGSKRPFKDIIFLIRDWNNSSFEYGTAGGEEYINHVWKEAQKNNNLDFLNLGKNLLNDFKNVNCSLLPSKNDKLFEEKLAQTCEFLISNSQMEHFTNNGRETLENFKFVNQKHDFFQYVNLFDDNVQIFEHEKFFPELSTSTNSFLLDNQNSLKNKNPLQVNENQRPPKSTKKLKSSKCGSDDDDDSNNDYDDSKNEIGRACKGVEQTKSFNNLETKSASNSLKDYKQSVCANNIKLMNNKSEEKEQKKKLFTLDDVKKYLIELSTNNEECVKIFNLPEDIFIHLFKFLNDDIKLNLIYTSEGFINIFQVSRTILKTFEIKVNVNNFHKLWNHRPMHRIPLINLSFDFKGVKKNQNFLLFIKKFKGSIEQLEIKNADFKNYNDLFEFLGNIPNLKSLRFENCKIGFVKNEILPEFFYLEEVNFNKCNDNIFKVLQNQPSICQLTVRNDDWTWNGFPHDIFNQMATKAKKLKKIVLIGSGTGSFFDSDEFTFNVEILDTSMITFHWYVGIRSRRVNFLKTQLGHLKKLTIHQLPFDFDGGKVLKYIIEEMNLNEFYYGKIPLILGGEKQDVKEFEATEIHITSIYEMFEQFSTISTFRLTLSATDIASDAIERVINPPTNLFNNLENFEVIDNSNYKGILGVYLGLFKNMKNLRKLSLITQDRNINTLLEEFLPNMPKLEEIYITSVAPRATERLQIIKIFVLNLKKLSVASDLVDDAKKIFNESFVQIFSVDKNQVVKTQD